MEIPKIKKEEADLEKRPEKQQKYFFVKTTEITPPAFGLYPAGSGKEATEKLRKEFGLYKKDVKKCDTREITREEFEKAMAQRYRMMVERRKEDEN